MATRTIVLTLAVGEPRPGLWCDRCALPSVFEVDVHALHAGGVSRVGTWAMCTECDVKPDD